MVVFEIAQGLAHAPGDAGGGLGGVGGSFGGGAGDGGVPGGSIGGGRGGVPGIWLVQQALHRSSPQYSSVDKVLQVTPRCCQNPHV